MEKNRNMKGISLPVETVVIITVIILVLVVIAAFFVLNVGKSTSTVGDDAAFGQGCVDLGTRYNCNLPTGSTKETVLGGIKINNYFPNGGTVAASLLVACSKKGYDATTCWKACGCPASSASASSASSTDNKDIADNTAFDGEFTQESLFSVMTDISSGIRESETYEEVTEVQNINFNQLSSILDSDDKTFVS